MNIWESLGIEYTNDIAAIRKAYAAKAKEVHPEEHPEEFQALQHAYKTAVKIAKLTRPSMRIPVPEAEGAEKVEQGEAGESAADDTEKGGKAEKAGDAKAEDAENAENAKAEDTKAEDAEKDANAKNAKSGEAEKAGEAKVEYVEKAQKVGEGKEGDTERSGKAERTEEDDVKKAEKVEAAKARDTEDASSAKEPLPEHTAEEFQQFDYGSVQELSEDMASRFWEEFQYIRWNPCLRNQLACWKLFLHQPEYEKLFIKDDFREELVRQILKDRPYNWTLPVIEYLTRTLKSFHWEKKKRYETDSRKWQKFRKRTPAQKSRTSKHLIPSPFLTRRERKLFCSIEGTEALAWEARVNMEQYLNDYFALARENSHDLKKMYKRHTRWVILGPVVIGVLVLVVFNAWAVLPNLFFSGSQDSRPYYEQTLEQIRQEYEQNGQNEQERARMQEDMDALLEYYENLINGSR
ncbi:MAG: hypothetical protein NC417_02785 [Candidatus Gastranaerophilales bacterium]|nr:hypothetical protein [Candidatus Gastranaerophilales bacterium]